MLRHCHALMQDAVMMTSASVVDLSTSPKTDLNRQLTAFKAVASTSCATRGNWSERKVLPPLPLASKASALLDELRPDMAVPRRFELPFSALTTQRPGR
jgi:hypothetical protein